MDHLPWVCCRVNHTPRSYLHKIILKDRDVCFSFRFELLAEGLRTENHCEPSPILTIGCQATLPPRRPSLEPLYRRVRARHDSGRLKGADVSILNDCKSAALTQSTCCWHSCWLMTSPQTCIYLVWATQTIIFFFNLYLIYLFHNLSVVLISIILVEEVLVNLVFYLENTLVKLLMCSAWIMFTGNVSFKCTKYDMH